MLPGMANSCLPLSEKYKLMKVEHAIDAAKNLCRKFTGPHSVLQIFLEKIIACIVSIEKQLKTMAKQ